MRPSGYPPRIHRQLSGDAHTVGRMDKPITRRGSLLALGGLAAGALGWKTTDDADAVGAVASGAVACVLTPELTEGPYYVDGEKLRRDVRDGRPGALLTLNLG